jgi:hypothetical protein
MEIDATHPAAAMAGGSNHAAKPPIPTDASNARRETDVSVLVVIGTPLRFGGESNRDAMRREIVRGDHRHSNWRLLEILRSLLEDQCDFLSFALTGPVGDAFPAACDLSADVR